MIELLTAVVELVTVALEDDYDEEKERQAMFKLQRTIAEERLRRLLLSPR